MTPQEALLQASNFIVTTLWPNTISMITNSYFLMIILFLGILAGVFQYFTMAKDNVK